MSELLVYIGLWQYWFMEWIIYLYSENDLEECGLELDFTSDFEVLGKLETHELKEGGAKIKVTEENKKEYIE